MKDINKNYNCTGCGACYNACPAGAITMENDEYGFYKPMINQEKCINCGLCEKKCPLNGYISKNIERPNAYALQNKDDVQRYKSASGGAFPLFARYIIEQNGIVFGVVWDKNLVACHTKAENLDELEKMYSSKYVQSNTKDTFKLAKIELDKGRLVLYSGTPCQIAGLKSYLNKEYENLLTLDLICHGTPSPMLFELYKKEFMKNKPKEKLLDVNFRSKKSGWDIHYKTHYTTTTTTVKSYDNKGDYWVSIMNHSFNKSCSNCKFTGYKRIADISMGDFWGVDEYDKNLNDHKGLSVILINNTKGEILFNKIKHNAIIQKIPYEVAIKQNPNIYKSSKAAINSEAFFADIISGKSLNYCAKKYANSLPLRIYRILPQFAKNFVKYQILKMEKQ
jgi:coenzyme F420-reducing hydrogenase beta subunit